MSTHIPRFEVSDRMRKARQYSGLDQAQMAQRAGISRHSVHNYESGERVPPHEVIVSWAEATGVDSTWLETGEEDETASQKLLADLDQWLRARRDSNPQPSDWESWTAAA